MNHSRPHRLFECWGYHDAPASMGGTYSSQLIKTSVTRQAAPHFVGWRRSHSARVWQAIQAVLAVAAVDDCREWVHPGGQRYVVALEAGWLTEEAR
jgi:hypothetical protein